MFRNLVLPTQITRQPPACQECGCKCSLCQNNSLDWHHEIEELKAKLVDATTRAAQAEHELVENRCKTEQDVARIQEDLVKQRDRYERLYDSYKKLQKVNNDLEDKLLNVVSKLSAENQELKGSLACMQSKLTEVETAAQYLEDECDRLKSDCIIAVQLLQCRPSEFVSYKLSELPVSLKDRVRSQLTPRELLELEEADDDAETIAKPVRVPITTFPPTAVSFLRPMNDSTAPNSGDENSIRRVNTVPMSLVARALLPVSSVDDSGVSRRRRGDAYICANCRRCDSAVDGGAGRRTGNGLECNDCSNGDEQKSNNAGVHTPRKCASQAMFHLQCSGL